MDLYVKLMAISGRFSEPASDPIPVCCPPDLAPDDVVPFLTGLFGAPVEVAWTSADGKPCASVGWVFAGPAATATEPKIDFACIPLIGLEEQNLQLVAGLPVNQPQQAE